ncbi:MAG: hypothetical protein RL754_278 [Bacteroidota bacterium]|jgi:shikimate kinase
MIILLGYMGSGKSTLGKELAERHKKRFIDLDQQVELAIGTSIADFILNRGELRFRKVEHEVLLRILQDSDQDAVLALGGGTPVFYDHMSLLNDAGTTVYLDVSVNELAKRLSTQSDTRPLLQGHEDMVEFVAKHLFERREFYFKAKLRLQGDALTAAQLEQLLGLV